MSDSIHPSQRGYFAHYLLEAARKDKDIILITADLGYGMWDKFRDELPNQFYNTGAAEQAAMGIAVGLAMSGKKPFIYSITTFLLYRPFETIRNYINHEKWPVRLVGGGRDKDYEHDGFSHWSEDVYTLFDTKLPSNFPEITALWPEEKEEIPEMVEQMVKESRPWFISLRR